MRDGWRRLHLASVVHISRDLIDPSMLPADEQVTYYSIPALDETGAPVRQRAGEIASGKFRVMRPSVLVSLLNPRIPRVYLAPGSRDSICSTEFAVLQPKVDAGLLPQFLYLIASSRWFRDELARRVAGTTGSRQRVRPDALRELGLEVPPLAEQRRIADLIGALDGYADCLSRVSSSTAVTLSALRREMEADSPQRALSVWATVVMGQSPDGATVNPNGVGEPLLNGPTEFGRLSPTATRQWTTDAARRCQAGDVLCCVRGATAGRLNLALQPYAIGRGLAAVRGKDPVVTRWAWHALFARVSDLLPSAGGTIFPNISGPALKGLVLGRPSPASIGAAVEVLDVAEQLAEEAHVAADHAMSLRATLVEDLLKGEQRIADSYDRFLDPPA